MKRVGRITRRGPSLLRGMLIEVAWMVYRLQRLGEAFRAERQPRDEAAEEDCDRGAGTEAAGEAVGDAAGWERLARSGSAAQSKGEDGGAPPAGVGSPLRKTPDA